MVRIVWPSWRRPRAGGQVSCRCTRASGLLPTNPARPPCWRAGAFIASELSGIRYLELLPPLVYVGLAHRERLVRCGCLAVCDPGELDILVHGQVDHLAGCPGRSRRPQRSADRSSRPQSPKSSTTLVPSRSACRATEMSRPSSTNVYRRPSDRRTAGSSSDPESAAAPARRGELFGPAGFPRLRGLRPSGTLWRRTGSCSRETGTGMAPLVR